MEKISKRKLGRNFEKEAYSILKEKFEEVVWLSEKYASTFDFLVMENGKSFYAEAKHSTVENKPTLLSYQSDAEILIFKGKDGKIKIIRKKDFKDKVNIMKRYGRKKIDWNNKKINIGVINGYGHFRGIEINPIYAKIRNLKEGDLVYIDEIKKVKDEK